MSIEEVTQAAMLLDIRERAKLAQKLLSSLECLAQEEIEALWVEEAERRSREMDRLADPGTPAEEVLRNLRQRSR